MKKQLRKTNLRWVGLFFIGFGVLGAYKIDKKKSVLIRYGVPAVMILSGVLWMSRKSEHLLWFEGNALYWKSTEGKKVQEGSVSIDEINKMILYKRGSSNSIQWVEVELLLDSGETVSIPKTINFGGTGNPKYEDVLNLMREFKRTIDFELIDNVKKNYL